jgi:hypothetical protein
VECAVVVSSNRSACTCTPIKQDDRVRKSSSRNANSFIAFRDCTIFCTNRALSLYRSMLSSRTCFLLCHRATLEQPSHAGNDVTCLRGNDDIFAMTLFASTTRLTCDTYQPGKSDHERSPPTNPHSVGAALPPLKLGRVCRVVQSAAKHSKVCLGAGIPRH